MRAATSRQRRRIPLQDLTVQCQRQATGLVAAIEQQILERVPPELGVHVQRCGGDEVGQRQPERHRARRSRF